VIQPRDEPVRGGRPNQTGLEGYRHLVELQKQLVEMVKRNEQSKQKCEALRKQIIREAEVLRSPTLRVKMKRLTGNLLRQLAQGGSFLRGGWDNRLTRGRQPFES
jgi:hypothetical protein